MSDKSAIVIFESIFGSFVCVCVCVCAEKETYESNNYNLLVSFILSTNKNEHRFLMACV